MTWTAFAILAMFHIWTQIFDAMSSYADEADDEGKQESELSESLQCIGVPSQVLVRVGLLELSLLQRDISINA